MKIVVACDSFKGCMTSAQAVECIQKGIHKADPLHQVDVFPMCDGGEGTTDVFCALYHGKKVSVKTLDAYGKELFAEYAIVEEGNKAVMEVSSCIGLSQVPKHRRNPMIANSRGVGIMIRDAVKKGCTELIIGIGGTSTNDGGMGLLQTLGVRFKDKEGRPVKAGAYGLNRIETVDTTMFSFPKDVRIIVANDVKNPLLGPDGATYMYGRQKGLYESQLAEVDAWMEHYRDKLQEAFHTDINTVSGAGAAGGIGAVLGGILHAEMVSGITLCMEAYGLRDVIAQADLVITGEGQTDRQTACGKVPFGVARLAKEMDKPVLCLSGALGQGYQALYECGFDGIYSSADRAMDFQTAIQTAPQKLEDLAFTITKTAEAFLKIKEESK